VLSQRRLSSQEMALALLQSFKEGVGEGKNAGRLERGNKKDHFVVA